MARQRSEGQVVERRWKRGYGYALRFVAYDRRHYITLGLERDGWTRQKAETELANILADVRRGLWVPTDRRRPTKADASSDGEVPLFGPFARKLIKARKDEVQPRTYEYLDWGLSHLLPYFADWPLDQINVEAVDGYRGHKVAQAKQRRNAAQRRPPVRDEHGLKVRSLSAGSINKTIDVLQLILEVALERHYLPNSENPAAGKRRRLKPPAKPPVYLDTAEQIQVLIDAAGRLDGQARWRCSDRRAIITTLILAGPRASELCDLEWRDVDLANGRIYIGRSKTQAGLREIPLLPLLRDELAVHKAGAYRPRPDSPVFPTATGGRRDKDNLRSRVLIAAIAEANTLLEERELPPLPDGLTAHKLRHTFASVLVALGHDPTSVMAALGHTDAKFTLKVYSHLMRRDPAERARLKALVNGEPIESATPEPSTEAELVSVLESGGH